MIRRIAFVSQSQVKQVKHFRGFPPEVVPEYNRQELPRASILVLVECEKGFLLNRYAADGEFAGDTWHPTLDDALEQAEFEFDIGSRAWHDVPAGVSDVYEYLFPPRER